MREKVRMVCAHCGGEDVRANAYASWNADAQTWEIAQTFEKGAYCSECESETHIEQRPTQV
jgi:hypothetical protein